MSDWRELLSQVLDGESLSDAAGEQLRAALADEANWREASDWVRFEQTVHNRWPDGEEMSKSRDRLLAKVILHEKHAEITSRRGTGNGSRWKSRVMALATVAAAVIAWFVWRPVPSTTPPAIAARGDFRILGGSDMQPDAQPLRGDRLIAGGNGAEVALGGYCRVNLVSHTEVTLAGKPRREAIELHQGEVKARVTPDRGEFRVFTPLGAIEVKGTEFETTVEYPNGLPGDQSMSGPKSVVVTVAVLSGAVLFQADDKSVLLETGANRVFAGEAESRRTRGEVTAVTDFSVTIKVDGVPVTFHVLKQNKLAVHEVGQLLKGDQITVTWVAGDGRRLVRDIDGEGVIEGAVTALGDAWIELQVDGGRKLRYRAPWRGGNPADGGGPDRDVVRKLGTVRVGDRVAVTWGMPEGKRVMNVAVRQRGERPVESAAGRGDLTKAPPELYGLSGQVLGRLVEKDVEQGELTLQIVRVQRVWRNNKARNPKSAEGRTLKIDGVFGKFLDVLLTLKKGDGVQIEVKHVRGDGLTFLGEQLKKVVLEEPRVETPRTEKTRTEKPRAEKTRTEKPRTEKPASDRSESADGTDAPAGLSGFRGILIGRLLSKDIEKGTLVFKMEKVKRVWRQNKAPAPERSVGKPLAVEGIAGKFLDTLLVLEVGDRIEVEAFQVRGPTLKFPGEWLKKAESN